MNDTIDTQHEGATTYFVTGATGLMGSEFVYEVLKRSPYTQCILLIRATTEAKMQSRLCGLMKYLFPDETICKEMQNRVTAVRGEVDSKCLGMSSDHWEQTTKTTNYILHAAALTDWGASIEDATRVNVSGVGEVLAFAHACGGLKKLIHISTAYVSGFRSGNILPTDTNPIENTCDNYQRSKIKGEELIRNEFSRLPITIVRPGAVVGNASNGRTPNYKTFYFPLQIMYNGLPLLLPVNKHGNLEAVPSDWTAKVMLEMMLDNQTDGNCYHLTGGRAVQTNAELKKVVLKTFNDLGETPKGAWFIPYFFYNLVVSKLVKSRLPSGEGLDEKIRLYRHYMTYKRVFDNESTMAFIKDKDIPLPHFNELCD